MAALGTGGVDYAVVDIEPIPDHTYAIVEEVKQRQVGNVVEVEMPWRGESGITVRHDLGELSVMERIADKRKQEAIIDQSSFGEGGIKFDIILNEKPDTNRFCHQVEGWEDYNWWYQPELTREEIEQGNQRPENIVGSYAVYHKELRDNCTNCGTPNYKIGKAFHIERPQVWEVGDKEATKRWAELDFDEGELCVTAPKEFLDGAEYPVRIDPTLGYTTIGTSNRNLGLYNAGTVISYRSGRVYNVASAMDVSKMSAAIKLFASETIDIDTILLINDEDSAGSGSHDEEISSESLNKTYSSTSYSWYDFTMSATLVADDYIISALGNGQDIADNTGETVQILQLAWDTLGSSENTYYEQVSGSSSYSDLKEDPWTEDSFAATTQYSLYITYTIPAVIEITGVSEITGISEIAF